MMEEEMTRDKVHFCTASQRVSLLPRDTVTKAVLPEATKMSRVVVIALVVVAVALLSAFVVFLFVRQHQKPASDVEHLVKQFQAMILEPNTTGQLSELSDAPYHPITEPQMQEAIQMLKDQVEKAGTRSMELERLKYSSQIQLLSSRLTNATADIQVDLKDDLLLTQLTTVKIQEKHKSLQTSYSVLAGEGNLLGVQNEHLQLILEGWKSYKNHLYYFSFDKKSWHEAEKFCMSKGAHLASVTSEDEQAFVSRFSGGFRYWIGLTNNGKKDAWHWVDGTPYKPVSGRTFWAKSQPDNWVQKGGPTEDCVHVYPTWNDIRCDSLFYWVCKKPMSMKVA
ncbi:C-type lectin domain family 4 member K-like [Rhynchocyon petersi]